MMGQSNCKRLEEMVTDALRAFQEEANRSMVCPFCGDTNFDQIGLKIHLSNGRCQAYEDTPLWDTLDSANDGNV